MDGLRLPRTMPRGPVLRALGAVVATSALFTVIFAAAAQDAWRLGFLLWFRHEGRGVEGEGTLLLVVFLLAVTLGVSAFAGAGRARPFETAANVAMKAALLAAVAFMLAHPGLPQFENKSLTARAVLFPLLAAVPALVWLVRRRPSPYPTLIDLCLTTVLAVDIVGNDLHWYGNYKHWDDCVHFLSSLPIMFVMVSLLLALERNGVWRLGFWPAILFAGAIYGSLHGLWEISEHLSDRVMETDLQPGGMVEASRNNIAAMGGSATAIVLLWWWRGTSLLEEGLIAPLAGYLGPDRQ